MYYSFILIHKNQRRVKLQSLQFEINSKTINLHHVKSVIVFAKCLVLDLFSLCVCVFLLSLFLSSLSVRRHSVFSHTRTCEHAHTLVVLSSSLSLSRLSCFFFFEYVVSFYFTSLSSSSLLKYTSFQVGLLVLSSSSVFTSSVYVYCVLFRHDRESCHSKPR